MHQAEQHFALYDEVEYCLTVQIVSIFAILAQYFWTCKIIAICNVAEHMIHKETDSKMSHSHLGNNIHTMYMKKAIMI